MSWFALLPDDARRRGADASRRPISRRVRGIAGYGDAAAAGREFDGGYRIAISD